MTDNCSPDRRAHFGDLLAKRNALDPKAQVEAPLDRQVDFESTIRACAGALAEDPDDLLRLAQGTTPLARLTRFLLGEQHPTARLSRDQVLYDLHETLRQEGLRGQALWIEVVRRHTMTIEIDSAQRAVRRYRKHLRELGMPGSLPEVFAPKFSIDKKVKTRGPKPKQQDRT